MTLAPVVTETVYALAAANLGPFSTVFTYEQSSDVVLQLDTAGTWATLVSGVDYTLTATGGNSSLNGGQATLSAALLTAAAWPAGAKLCVTRVTAADQPSAFGEVTGFSPQACESALDHVARRVQDLATRTPFSPRAGPGVALASLNGALLTVGSDGYLEASGLTAAQLTSGSVQILPNLPTIAALRANAVLGASQYWVQGGLKGADGGEGVFLLDPADHATADDGGTVIVDAAAQRWKRATGGGVYSALWFCPHKDGLTDDTAILQQAVNAALAAGRALYIPAGTYALAATLNLHSATGGHHVFGDAPQWSNVTGLCGGTILKSTNVAGAHALSLQNGANGQNLLRNFAILGSGTNGNGIDGAAIYTTFLEKLYVTGHGGHGIKLPQCFDMHVTECNIGNNKEAGIYLAGEANGTVVRGCLFFNNDTAGFGFADIFADGTVGNSLDLVIRDNVFEGGANSEFGVSASHCNGLLIEGNYFEIYKTSLVYLGPTVQGFLIASNYFQDAAVTIDQATQGLITANVFQKEGAATTLQVNTPAGGNNKVRVDDSNVFLGGATYSGPAAKGQATLVAGTVTVNNTNVNAATAIMLSRDTLGAAPGFLAISAVVNGVSFTISSSNAGDTGVVQWMFA